MNPRLLLTRSLLAGLLLLPGLAACGADSSSAGEEAADTAAAESEQHDAAPSDTNGLVGTYKVDVEAQMRAAGNSDAQIAAGISKMREAMQMSLTVNADGTWTVTGSSMGSPVAARGTWKPEGKGMTMTTTHVDGQAQPSPMSNPAELRNGYLYVDRGAGAPATIMKKQ